jgi:hypothetical protein
MLCPNGGRGGAWRLTFTLSPVIWDDSPATGITRLLISIQNLQTKNFKENEKI